MTNHMKHRWTTPLVVAAALLASPMAQADVVTDWNITASNIAVAAQLPPPPAYRVMAMAQSAVYEAVNAITKRDPPERMTLDAASGASVEAAVAAANRATLLKLVPSQQAAIDSAYQIALSAIADSPAKREGIAVGDKAAAAILALRADDGAATSESYRPHTTAGVYVPTVIPAVPQWPQRKPWVMTSANQFRPGPPPSLTSDSWARDYNESKALGAKNSTTRSTEQTAIARFWEDIVSLIYFPVVRSVANAPGREVTQNAHLFAAVTQAIDDAYIAIFDAKYHYNFWRPITAIRNGDTDGNAATEREASWAPFIDTPMHPEYPCAHCIVSGAVGTVLQAEIGTGLMPTLTTTSDTAPGVARSWTNIDDFMQEVANARIYDGVHYRTSTEVGTEMGKKIGQLVAAKYFQPLK
ncbi:MAG: vanadium-dependent haloperoxidase [Deltaproteobacteria bacterium]|nr:vanadium-dependent haloperoxidase [Deltaproteobacteria bacterium]